MANRYVVASGNWNGPVWAATSGGAAGSAATPNGNDDVFIDANFTLSVNVNFQSIKSFTQTNGTLNLGANTLTVYYSFSSTGTTARTINLGSGKLDLQPSDANSHFTLSGSNLTFTPGTSTISVNRSSYPSGALNFATNSVTFNDVAMSLGSSSAGSSTENITGSPTFRLLDIRSANSAAHTVTVDSSAQIKAQKLILLGASSSNKLNIQPVSGGATFTVYDSSYGQFVNIGNINTPGPVSSFAPMYIGSNSVASLANWLTQDPPKISTLVDPLTLAPGSNTNWTIPTYSGATLPTSAVSGAMGGGYTFDNYTDGIVSADTYDIVDQDFIFEVSGASGTYLFYGGVGWLSGQSFANVFFNVGMNYGGFVSVSGTSSTGIDISSLTSKGKVVAPSPSGRYFIKLRYDSSVRKFKASYSTNGTTWLNETTSAATLPDGATEWMRSSRIQFNSNNSGAVNDLGSINPVLISPPSISTGTAGSITLSSAAISGSAITANPDNVTVTERGVVYATTANPTTANNKVTGSGSPFNVIITGLSEETTYYVRAYASWADGVAYGSQITFKTKARPTVTLDIPANNGSVSALRPTLDFTAVDPDSDTITYQLQLHTSNTWTSPLLDVSSAGGAGFSNRSDSKTDPFYSGNQIRYTPQTDLARGTDYYWRVRGKDVSGTNTWGDWTTGSKFTVAAIAPSVTIQSAFDVTFTAAKISAEVTLANGATVTERGVVYATTANPTTANSKLVTGSGVGAYTSNITGLTGSTKYYVRAYAINSAGTSYSTQIDFTTLQTPAVPTVTTGAASNPTDITSEFNGSTVTQDGTFTVTERGIVFSSTNTTPTLTDRKIVAPAGGLGTYNLGITGLNPETTYYVRAYATSSFGTGYGTVKTFTTLPPFVPDEGDGYWTWTPSGSDAVISRSQSTPANSSANLMLADLNLENGATYTLRYAEKTNTNGATKMVLQRFVSGVKTQTVIAPNTPFTFVYNTSHIHWAIRLFVTGASVEANNITATFSDLYLAKESTYSGFVPFVANGLTEIKLENNWLADKQRSDVITTMFSAMKGLSWYPFNIDTEGLGWFEIGDKFTIQDNTGKNYPVVMWNSKLTVDGGIKETLFTKTPDLTETNYAKAGKLGGLWKRTQIEVDKNKQEIQSLVEAVYDFDGVINTKFSEVFQDVDQIRTTVQGTGGVNLIQNSVMYAFNTSNVPNSWTVSGAGTLAIQASPESLTAGAVAGNAFTLTNKTVKQTVTVRKDVAFIPEAQKTYYAISAKVKKNLVGTAWIKLTNRNQTLTIPLPDQTSYYWDTVKLEEILPLDDYYEIEIYSDASAGLQVTDLILAPGKTKREWSQANGEVMNSSVSITKDGMTIRSPQFQNDYTKIDALGFEVHSKEVGGDRVFGFNKDETNVAKLKADKQISMAPLRAVPINYGSYKGWAFTISENS